MNKKRIEKISKITIFLIIFLLFFDKAYSSAWLQEKNKMIAIFEISREFSDKKVIFSKKDFTYYNSNLFKLYLEYGLFNSMTIGGYLENYNLYSKYYDKYDLHKSKIKNDYYGNIFLKQKLFKQNNSIFSIDYSFYFPINYSNADNISNIIDRQNAYEISLNFGKNDDIYLKNNFELYLKYFVDTSISYKIINNFNNDELTFKFTTGFSKNDSSLFYIQYEYKNYPSSNILKANNISTINNLSNINKIKLAHNYKISKNKKVEFSYQKIFSKVDADNLSVLFIFNN